MSVPACGAMSDRRTLAGWKRYNGYCHWLRQVSIKRSDSTPTMTTAVLKGKPLYRVFETLTAFERRIRLNLIEGIY